MWLGCAPSSLWWDTPLGCLLRRSRPGGSSATSRAGISARAPTRQPPDAPPRLVGIPRNPGLQRVKPSVLTGWPAGPWTEPIPGLASPPENPALTCEGGRRRGPLRRWIHENLVLLEGDRGRREYRASPRHHRSRA